MNWVDLIYMVLVLGGLALGFFQGTIKLVVAIVSFYVGIILASLYFQTVGNFFRIRFNSSVDVSQITAFALILLLSFVILTIAGLYTFRYARLPAGLDLIDKVAGTFFGLIMAVLLIAMISILLRNLMIYRSIGDLATLPIASLVQSGVRASRLLPYFADYLLPLLYGAIRPILPDESRIIFQVR
ncbi:MAG: CvpA family protein [Roseiflexaceae bacterium]